MSNETNNQPTTTETPLVPTEPTLAPTTSPSESVPAAPAAESHPGDFGQKSALSSTPEPIPNPEPEPTLQSAPTPQPTSTPESTPTQQSAPESVPASSPVPSSEPEPSLIKNLLLRAREKIQFRKRKKLERILKLAQEKGKITNNDVEKLLRVSDKTAERYLGQLVKEGKLARQGKPKNAFYCLP